MHLNVDTETTMSPDYRVMCTGWTDHFGMFDDDMKATLGLPYYCPESFHAFDAAAESDHKKIDWHTYDEEAEREVNKRLPILSSPPKLKFDNRFDPSHQRKWLLYRRAIPIELALKGDRSIAIMGQIHTV
ncbi:hypothetical protein QQS21_005630 [Conoideocrella luteorostrata]|uniref:Uncharacterized protein n=1 Tax=Conoideocrella luteorostrata TaxID=1105319 RepID=A0AAJ0CTB5_9HYPO|nr:hypothetical protein QQS21_005630 [Conoideocrella luteorostrata]